MKKIIAILLSVFLLSAFMTGCSAWDEFAEGFEQGVTDGQNENNDDIENSNTNDVVLDFDDEDDEDDDNDKDSQNEGTKTYSVLGYTGDEDTFCNIKMTTNLEVETTEECDSIMVYEEDSMTYATIYIDEKPLPFDSGDGISVSYGEYYGDSNNINNRWNVQKVTYYEENKTHYLLYSETTLDGIDACLTISSTDYTFAQQVASSVQIDGWSFA